MESHLLILLMPLTVVHTIYQICLPHWQYIIPSSVSDRIGTAPTGTSWCWFQRKSKCCISICFRPLCCWRHLEEKGHTLNFFRIGWRKSVSVPKSSNERCESIVITICIFGSVGESLIERFVLYVTQFYTPLILSYPKPKDFYFPFMGYKNHKFPSVKYMQDVEWVHGHIRFF